MLTLGAGDTVERLMDTGESRCKGGRLAVGAPLNFFVDKLFCFDDNRSISRALKFTKGGTLMDIL